MTVECRASSAGGDDTDGLTIKVDSTAPSVTGAAPDRRPDTRGWFRAPFSVAFAGDDALSGIEACTRDLRRTGSPPGPPHRRVPGHRGQRERCAHLSVPLRRDGPAGRACVAVPSSDHRGWYARPVRFRFRARDAVSGAARCAPVTFRGPEGRGAVRATCVDRAGNLATRDFPIRYDATPPAIAVRVDPGHRMAILRWRASRDARSFQLVRWIRDAPWTRTVVYRGRRHRHLDAQLVDGRVYRYVLVARTAPVTAACGAYACDLAGACSRRVGGHASARRPCCAGRPSWAPATTTSRSCAPAGRSSRHGRRGRATASRRRGRSTARPPRSLRGHTPGTSGLASAAGRVTAMGRRSVTGGSSSLRPRRSCAGRPGRSAHVFGLIPLHPVSRGLARARLDQGDSPDWHPTERGVV